MATEHDLFDLSLEEDIDSFDPLADTDDDDAAEGDAPAESGVITADPKEFPGSSQLAQTAEELRQRPAPERIATLFDNMQPYHRTLHNIIDAARTPIANDQMKDLIDTWQADKRSVYSPDNLCMMLKRAGALDRVTADGDDYDQVEQNIQPEHVIINGTEFLKPATMPELYWQATEDGLAYVDADNPSVHMRELIEGEPQYRHLFKLVLEEAAKPDGTNEKILGPMIDHDPAAQKPRMYAMGFVDKLAKVDALIWHQKAWRITDTGRLALEFINELDADASADARAE